MRFEFGCFQTFNLNLALEEPVKQEKYLKPGRAINSLNKQAQLIVSLERIRTRSAYNSVVTRYGKSRLIVSHQITFKRKQTTYSSSHPREDQGASSLATLYFSTDRFCIVESDRTTREFVARVSQLYHLCFATSLLMSSAVDK